MITLSHVSSIHLLSADCERCRQLITGQLASHGTAHLNFRQGSKVHRSVVIAGTIGLELSAPRNGCLLSTYDINSAESVRRERSILIG